MKIPDTWLNETWPEYSARMKREWERERQRFPSPVPDDLFGSLAPAPTVTETETTPLPFTEMAPTVFDVDLVKLSVSSYREQAEKALALINELGQEIGTFYTLMGRAPTRNEIAVYLLQVGTEPLWKVRGIAVLTTFTTEGSTTAPSSDSSSDIPESGSLFRSITGVRPRT